MSELPKPTIMETSKWELDYYKLRSPTMTKDEFLKGKLKNWYRYQYHKQFNK
jgi:hypothetical protein